MSAKNSSDTTNTTAPTHSSNPPKLTEGSIPQHVLRLAIPSSMGMIFNTLYNLSDYWFAGRLSSEALAGVSIASTVFYLLIAAGIGIQIGTSAIIAAAIGSDKRQEAKRWTREVIGLSLVTSAITMVLGWSLAAPTVSFLGAEPNVAPYAITYIRFIVLAIPFFTIGFAAAGILMAYGDTKSNRNALAIGLILNLILNPILMFGFGWGVAGLAIATGLIKLFTGIYLMKKIGNILNDAAPRPAFNISQWGPLLKQVLPASFNMLSIILGSFITVSMIGRFGSQHVAGYSVGLRLEQLLLLPALGMNSAVMAIAGQNFGARNFSRVRETYTASLRLGLVMTAVSIPIMVFLSPLLMKLFTPDAAIIATGTAYLRIDAIAFFAYVVLFISTATLQSIKQPLFPMAIGLTRHLIAPLSINILLIAYLSFPMISIFYTLITVVIISAITSHFFTQQRLSQLQAGSR